MEEKSGVNCFYGPDIFALTQPTVSKHWRKHRTLTQPSGLALSLLHLPPDSLRILWASLRLCQLTDASTKLCHYLVCFLSPKFRYNFDENVDYKQSLTTTVGHSMFLDLRSGISCPKLFRRRHFQVSGVDLNPSSFSSHILILSSNCTFDTIVVLVVLNWTERW